MFHQASTSRKCQKRQRWELSLFSQSSQFTISTTEPNSTNESLFIEFLSSQVWSYTMGYKKSKPLIQVVIHMIIHAIQRLLCNLITYSNLQFELGAKSIDPCSFHLMNHPCVDVDSSSPRVALGTTCPTRQTQRLDHTLESTLIHKVFTWATVSITDPMPSSNPRSYLAPLLEARSLGKMCSHMFSEVDHPLLLFLEAWSTYHLHKLINTSMQRIRSH